MAESRQSMTASLERLQIGGKRGAIHGQQRRDASDGWGLGPVERHQQRELAARQADGAQRVVETPRDRARGPLHVEVYAGVANVMGNFERQRIAG